MHDKYIKKRIEIKIYSNTHALHTYTFITILVRIYTDTRHISSHLRTRYKRNEGEEKKKQSFILYF